MFTNFFAHHSFLNLWPSFLDHFPSFWKNILRISLFKLSLVFVMYERKCESISCVWLFATPWYVAHQTPLSVEFSKQEYWSGLPFPSPEDLPEPGIEPWFPALWADSLPAEPPGKPKNTEVDSLPLLWRIFPTQELNQGLLHCRWIFYQLSY